MMRAALRPEPSSTQQSFGKYTLVAKLAAGGMGEIFLAKVKGVGGFEKLVVLKRLLDHMAEDANFVAMFLDEARIAARLSHPNVCSVHELGQEDGQYFIAMEYLEGLPVSKIVRKPEAPIDIRLAATLVHDACEGLHHAHELKDRDGELVGVVHRDVSPSNLFVTAAGVLKVLDFGIAKAQNSLAHTSTGTIKGKYAYMSPEQLQGEPLDRRSDIFSLGIVLHEALTGRRLFDRLTEFLIFDAIVKEPIPRVCDSRADVPPPLEQVVDRALSRDPAGRFATARELGRAIAAAIAPLGGPMINTEVAEALERDNAEELTKVRALVEQAATSPSLTPSSETLSVQNNDIELELTAATIASKSPVTPTPTDARPRPQTQPPVSEAPGGRGVSPLIWLTAIVVIAAATVIVVVVLSRDGRSRKPAPIIIQRNAVPVDAQPVRAANDAGSTQPTPAKSRPPRKRAGKANVYTIAVRRHKATFEGCYRKHPDTSAPDRFKLTFFDISPAGASARVRLSPSSLAASPLGGCLSKVARKIRFGRQPGAAKVDVTVHRR